jgi:DNA-binding NarL/FixJ family response regulator
LLVAHGRGLKPAVFDALAAGASGFLLKDVPPEDLVRAIRVTAHGDALLAPSITRRLIQKFTTACPSPARAARLARLTQREREVPRLLVGACPTSRSRPRCSSARAP